MTTSCFSCTSSDVTAASEAETKVSEQLEGCTCCWPAARARHSLLCGFAIFRAMFSWRSFWLTCCRYLM